MQVGSKQGRWVASQELVYVGKGKGDYVEEVLHDPFEEVNKSDSKSCSACRLLLLATILVSTALLGLLAWALFSCPALSRSVDPAVDAGGDAQGSSAPELVCEAIR